MRCRLVLFEGNTLPSPGKVHLGRERTASKIYPWTGKAPIESRAAERTMGQWFQYLPSPRQLMTIYALPTRRMTIRELNCSQIFHGRAAHWKGKEFWKSRPLRHHRAVAFLILVLRRRSGSSWPATGECPAGCAPPLVLRAPRCRWKPNF